VGLCAVAAITELAILSLGSFTFFRCCGNTLAESCAYGLITTLMALSLVFQSAFLVHLPAASLVIEALLVLLAVAFILRRRSDLHLAVRAAGSLCRQHPLACCTLGLVWAYLLLQAVLVPPDPMYWQPLVRVLDVAHHRALFPYAVGARTGVLQAEPSVANVLILPHLFLRCRSDVGIGLLGFTAYLSIGFSIYALSRRYAWPSTALTVALIAISLPRVVFLATSPGYDIIPTAVALFCLLAVFRTVETPNARDLYLFLLGILFMISPATLQLAFPIIMVLLAGLLLFRRHGVATWWHLVAARPWALPPLAVPVIIFSPLPPLLHDLLVEGGRDIHTVPAGFYNTDGLQGAAANAVRYLLQSIDLTQPVDSLLNWSVGFSSSGLLQKTYDTLLASIFDGRGAAAAFHISRAADAQTAWFGPFAFILVVPAVAYAVRRAPRRLKAVAVALVGYVFLVFLIPAWRSVNVRFFDVFFLCGSVCTAFFLPPWRVNRRGRRLLTAISAALLVYAAAFNEHRPALNLAAVWAQPSAPIGPSSRPQAGAGHLGAVRPAGSIWSVSQWGRNRYWPAALVYGDDRLDSVDRLIAEPQRLGLVYAEQALIYPFRRRFPAAMVLARSTIDPPALASLRNRRIAYLMFVDCQPPRWLGPPGGRFLWRAQGDTARLPGALLRLH
jgi:hypothetical protein